MTETVKTRVWADASPIAQLVERVGRTEAGKLMGVSNTNFGKWLTEGKAQKVYVDAAKYHISKMDREAHSHCIAIVVVPAEKRDAFDAIVKGLGLDTKYVVK